MLGQEILLIISNLRIIWSNKYSKNSDKEKYVYSAYGIKCDSASSWSFGNDFARNVVISGVDNSLSFHGD